MYVHTLLLLENLHHRPRPRWHEDDVGKPPTSPRRRTASGFDGHVEVGVKMAEGVAAPLAILQ